MIERTMDYGAESIRQLCELSADRGLMVDMHCDESDDPWYSFGSHDMLEVAHMGLHVAQMTGTGQIRQMFDAVTANGAKALGLKNYGLERACRANLVSPHAKDVHEALRLKPARLVCDPWEKDHRQHGAGGQPG